MKGSRDFVQYNEEFAKNLVSWNEGPLMDNFRRTRLSL